MQIFRNCDSAMKIIYLYQKYFSSENKIIKKNTVYCGNQMEKPIIAEKMISCWTGVPPYKLKSGFKSGSRYKRESQ